METEGCLAWSTQAKACILGELVTLPAHFQLPLHRATQDIWLHETEALHWAQLVPAFWSLSQNPVYPGQSTWQGHLRAPGLHTSEAVRLFWWEAGTHRLYSSQAAPQGADLFVQLSHAVGESDILAVSKQLTGAINTLWLEMEHAWRQAHVQFMHYIPGTVRRLGGKSACC